MRKKLSQYYDAKKQGFSDEEARFLADIEEKEELRLPDFPTPDEVKKIVNEEIERLHPAVGYDILKRIKLPYPPFVCQTILETLSVTGSTGASYPKIWFVPRRYAERVLEIMGVLKEGQR